MDYEYDRVVTRYMGSGITSRGIEISSVFNGIRDQALLDPTDNFKILLIFHRNFDFFRVFGHVPTGNRLLVPVSTKSVLLSIFLSCSHWTWVNGYCLTLHDA